MYSRKPTPGALASQERRRRENEAPRILSLCPALSSLTITVEEDGGQATPKYIRHIVVAHAPALFLVPCGDPHCSDGGHDITSPLLAALRKGETHTTGRHECMGSIGSSPCRRAITFEAVAEYSG